MGGIAVFPKDENGIVGGFEGAVPAVDAALRHDGVFFDHDDIAGCSAVLSVTAGYIAVNGASAADEHHVVQRIALCRTRAAMDSGIFSGYSPEDFDYVAFGICVLGVSAVSILDRGALIDDDAVEGCDGRVVVGPTAENVMTFAGYGDMDGKCAKFCVCQVLEGGGRNLSPLFYDVG